MKIALCCIGKLENRYIKEYVEYYYNIGVDKIFLYDNNDINGEHFEDVLDEFIKINFVELIDFRGQKVCQLKAYQDCYDKHSQEYDWIAFFDCDEFLTFAKHKDIKEYLSEEIFKDFDMIHINWMTYDDNDLINYEDKPLLERFTRIKEPIDFQRTYNFPENNHIKSIIRGNLGETIRWYSCSPHTPNGKVSCCTNNGTECNSISPFSSYDYSLAYIKHFSTKTIEEWIDIKQKRGFPDQSDAKAVTNTDLNHFFSINKYTQGKIDYIYNKLYKDKNKNVEIFIGAIKDISYDDNEHYKTIILGDYDSKDENALRDNTNDNISYINKSLCEFTGMYWIWKNYNTKNYVGFCQYRRLLNPNLFKITDIEKDIDENGIIIANRVQLNTSILNQYQYCHNVEDLRILKECVDRNFPEYSSDFMKMSMGNYMYSNNCFIMSKENFDKYCNFVWTVMKDVIDTMNIHSFNDCIKRVTNNKTLYLKNIPSLPQNGMVEYQSRFLAYLAERLTTVFVMKNFSKPIITKTIMIEKKYSIE